MDTVTTPTNLKRIRELNDRLRHIFIGGQVMLSATVAALPDIEKAKVLEAIRNYSSFNDDNDPHGEHDMAFVEVNGERYMSKIDYYDTDMRYLSDDPGDEKVTKRVMTIMHASDY